MKLERLMAITILLLNRKRVQAHELADRLEVYTGTEGGYEIMDSFRLDRQMLSLDELMALFTALRGLQSTQALNHANLDHLLDKVGALVSQAEQGRFTERDQILVDFTPWKNSDADRNKYESLQKAINERKMVHFTYTDGQGEDTQRSIEPMGLVLKGYAWYLHGYCLSREDYRIFRLTRIRDMKVQFDSFTRRAMALTMLNERWEKPIVQKSIDLVLRFSGEAKVSAADRFDEDEIERQSDGSLLVRTSLPDGKWVIGFLLHYKTDLLVLEPAHIAVEVKKMALEISAMYLDSGQVAAQNVNLESEL
ncbi:MAG: helix-turn-helix transcriptional regulator [Candidatus Pristimantibacillus sp.]